MKKFFVLQLGFYLLCSSLFCQSNDSLILEHLTKLTKTEGYRTHNNIKLLNKTAAYIFNYWTQYADTVFYQNFTVNSKQYKNVIARFGSKCDEKIVIGAHYDVCGLQEGADDNASGVVGLLELSRLFETPKLNYQIELVAYTLEEPPYFRSEHMGSYIHAKSLADNKESIYGMISLEMIGYFKNESHSQSYPIGLLKLFYGNKGDFITLVNKFYRGKFARKFTKCYSKTKIIKSKKFFGPKSLPGIDFSDHLNYWHFGYSSLMITDTAFYRNKNYHENTDELETLNIESMAKVVDEIYNTLMSLR